MAMGQIGVAGIGLCQKCGRVLQADQGVEARVHAFNALQKSMHHFTARHLLAMNGLGEFVGAEFGDNHA